MKHIVAVIFLFITNLCFAQRPYGNFHLYDIPDLTSGSERNVIDTVKPVSFIPLNEGGLGCFTGVFSAPDSGYVSGNNQYGDREKAQFYSLSQMGYGKPATVLSVVVYFGLKTLNATPEDIYAKVYLVDTTGFHPGAQVASSSLVNLTGVNTNGFATLFTFPTPVAVTDSFFISIALPINTGDTVAIVTTYDECSGFSGWSWEQWADSTWHTLLNSWILDIDLAIFPVMDLPYNVGIGELSEVESWSIYPNPSADNSIISIWLEKSELVEIRIYNSHGGLIEKNPVGYLMAGKNTIEFDLTEYESGLYLVEVQQGLHVSQKKMAVIND